MLTIISNKKHIKRFTSKQGEIERAWAEINMSKLKHNVQILRKALPHKCKIIAVVKANAYGHGSAAISRFLNKIGIYAFAVATLDEGIELRENGVKGEILILGYTESQRAEEIYRYNLSQTVVDAEHAEELNSFKKRIKVHIKVDTGMHRLGENYKHIIDIGHMFQYKNLHVIGIYTHLCASDSMKPDDVNFTKMQIKNFYELIEKLKQKQIPIPKIHIQSSYGILNYPKLQCDYARPGIALYGVMSTINAKTNLSLDLQPVLELKSRIALIRKVQAGEYVGYGCEFFAERNTKIAVLPIGYADGVPRNLSCSSGFVLFHGKKASIVGKICMDQLMIDVTDISGVKRGDIVTLIGKDGTEKITAEQVAEKTGTITNELLSRFSYRINRIYL